MHAFHLWILDSMQVKNLHGDNTGHPRIPTLKAKGTGFWYAACNNIDGQLCRLHSEFTELLKFQGLLAALITNEQSLLAQQRLFTSKEIDVLYSRLEILPITLSLMTLNCMLIEVGSRYNCQFYTITRDIDEE